MPTGKGGILCKTVTQCAPQLAGPRCLHCMDMLETPHRVPVQTYCRPPQSFQIAHTHTHTHRAKKSNQKRQHVGGRGKPIVTSWLLALLQ